MQAEEPRPETDPRGDQEPPMPPGPDHPPHEAPSPESADLPEDAASSESDELSELRGEREQLNERLLRVSADYQNFRRRAEHNARIAREQQVMDMAGDLLGVLDTLERALALDAEQTSTADVLAGVDMVRKEFLRTLERFGVERVEAEPGEPFDPNVHEAMLQQKDEQYEPNLVAQQFQPGYRLGEKLLRPAKVAVTS